MKQQQQQQKQQKDQKLKWRGMKRKKYIKKQNWQVIDLNEVGWSGSNASWLESLRSKRSKLAWGKGNSPSSTPAPPPPFPPPQHTLKQPMRIQLSFTASDALFNFGDQQLLNCLSCHTDSWIGHSGCCRLFKKEMLFVGWTTTLPAFCWAKKCQAMLNGGSLAHWLNTNDKGFCKNWLL